MLDAVAITATELTAFSKGFSIHCFVMHSRVIRHNFSVCIIAIPTTARRAFKGTRVARLRLRVAEEADGACSSSE